AVTEFAAGITPGSEPDLIAAGPDGNLWFTEFVGNRIGRVVLPNAPPTLAPIANQAVAAGQNLRLTLQGNDPNGRPLAYTATVHSLAYHLESTLGLYTSGNYYTNYSGGGEQWVQGTGGWYYILPSGALYQWSGSGLTGTLVAQLDPSYNANP